MLDITGLYRKLTVSGMSRSLSFSWVDLPDSGLDGVRV